MFLKIALRSNSDRIGLFAFSLKNN